MKPLFTSIALIISLSSFSQLVGWSFDQVVKLKGTDYKYEIEGTDEEFGERYSITYKKEFYIDGKYARATEIFSFRKSSNIVFKYLFMGAKKETDILSIIENNNQKFKVIDKGNKQPDFIWHDEKANVNYQLSVMSSIGNGEYKYINYFAIGE